MGKEGAGEGCRCQEAHGDGDADPREWHLWWVFRPGGSDRALSLPGLEAGTWAVTEQRRGSQCEVFVPAQHHLWAFLQGQQP